MFSRSFTPIIMYWHICQNTILQLQSQLKYNCPLYANISMLKKRKISMSIMKNNKKKLLAEDWKLLNFECHSRVSNLFLWATDLKTPLSCKTNFQCPNMFVLYCYLLTWYSLTVLQRAAKPLWDHLLTSRELLTEIISAFSQAFTF